MFANESARIHTQLVGNALLSRTVACWICRLCFVHIIIPLSTISSIWRLNRIAFGISIVKDVRQSRRRISTVPIEKALYKTKCAYTNETIVRAGLNVSEFCKIAATTNDIEDIFVVLLLEILFPLCRTLWYARFIHPCMYI